MAAEAMQLREILYDIIDTEDDNEQDIIDAGIHASQQTGIAMTNPIKKTMAEKGIVVNHFMNNVVNIKVNKNVVKALRVLDKMDQAQVITQTIQPVVIDVEKENKLEYTHGAVYKLAEAAFEKDTKLADLLFIVKKMYVQVTLAKCNTKKEAAGQLGVVSTSMSALLRSLDLQGSKQSDKGGK